MCIYIRELREFICTGCCFHFTYSHNHREGWYCSPHPRAYMYVRRVGGSKSLHYFIYAPNHHVTLVRIHLLIYYLVPSQGVLLALRAVLRHYQNLKDVAHLDLALSNTRKRILHYPQSSVDIQIDSCSGLVGLRIDLVGECDLIIKEGFKQSRCVASRSTRLALVASNRVKGVNCSGSIGRHAHQDGVCVVREEPLTVHQMHGHTRSCANADGVALIIVMVPLDFGAQVVCELLSVSTEAIGGEV